MKLYTLFRAGRPKTIPCPAARPRIGYIREYPPGYARLEWKSYYVVQTFWRLASQQTETKPKDSHLSISHFLIRPHFLMGSVKLVSYYLVMCSSLSIRVTCSRQLTKLWHFLTLGGCLSITWSASVENILDPRSLIFAHDWHREELWESLKFRAIRLVLV